MNIYLKYLMIPWISVGWQDSSDDLWAISCNTKNTESEGTGQKFSDDQVSYFWTLCKEEVFSQNEIVSIPLPFIEEALYSVCVWNGYLFSNRSQCRGVRRIGGNFHNRCGSYLGWTGWWTRPSLVKMDETSTMSSSTFSGRWTRPSWKAYPS